MLNGFTWTAFERVFSQVVVFIIGIVIARLVTPNEYGILGILMVFVNIASILIDSGFGSALIYYNKLDDRDLSTTFLLNFIISVIAAICVIVLAPFVEKFYELPHLSIYLYTVTSVIILNAFLVVPTSILKVRLDFKSLAITNVLSSLISGITAIVLAYQGFGVWALIVQIILRSLLQVLFLLYYCRWRIHIGLYKDSLHKLFKYAVNILTASWITKFTEEGLTFFIGKSFSPYSLGIYTRATQFSTLPSTSFGSIIIAVLFPSLSLVKDDKTSFYNVYNRIVNLTAMITIPFFFLLAVVSNPLIHVVLGEKWVDAAPILSILCIGRILFPVSNITEQAINACGRSDLFMRQQLYKMLAKALFIIPALFFNIYVVAIADAASSFVAYFITTMVAVEGIDLKIKDQAFIISRFILVSLVSSIFVYILSLYIVNKWSMLLGGTFLFVLVLMSILLIFFKSDLMIIKSFLKRSKTNL